MARRAGGDPQPRASVPAALAELLVDPQWLPGAACRGLAPLFDAEVRGETEQQRTDRHADAIECCFWCGARTRCADLAEQLPRAQRRGVWAGELLDG